MNTKLFTSESVTEGHPDKVCDQIADKILDELLTQDSQSRCDREVIRHVGYTDLELGFNGQCAMGEDYEQIEEGERISIPQLMKMTGLSRGFFYKNQIVRAEIDKVIEQQAGTIDSRRSILDKAMDYRINYR